MILDHPGVSEIVRHDPRYASEAYEFLFEALAHTQQMLDRVPVKVEPDPGPQYHVSGPELLRGACDLALQEFGLLAKTVFHQWGIHRTDDIGEIVFNLIEAELLSKTDSDDRNDFHDVFDLDRTLSDGYTIPLEEVSWAKRGRK
ncbi:MAG: hypothetical protein K8T89_13735 [Planctomycetes bacterium]|nr:hypothetical protein [Planctomycetota bacterium]